jgi:hypothetical protein
MKIMSRLTELLAGHLERGAGAGSTKSAEILRKMKEEVRLDRKKTEHLEALIEEYLAKGTTGASTTEKFTMGFAIGRWSELGGAYKDDPYLCWTVRLDDFQRKFVQAYRDSKSGRDTKNLRSF